MPRGVFARKTAQERMSALEPAQVTLTQLDAPVVHLVEPEMLGRPSFYKNQRVNIDTVDIDTLKQYARSIGILQRDVDSLSESRLRQNCKARVFQAMED